MMLVYEVDSHFSLLGFSLTDSVELIQNYVNMKLVYLKVASCPSPFSALKLIQ